MASGQGGDALSCTHQRVLGKDLQASDLQAESLALGKTTETSSQKCKVFVADVCRGSHDTLAAKQICSVPEKLLDEDAKAVN